MFSMGFHLLATLRGKVADCLFTLIIGAGPLGNLAQRTATARTNIASVELADLYAGREDFSGIHESHFIRHCGQAF
jgi:threonine dehydrogenase-like Zn-dependent dehydrogenase